MATITDKGFIIDDIGTTPWWDQWRHNWEKANELITQNSINLFLRPGNAQTATTFGSLVGSGGWIGGALAPNGKIYGIPFNSTTVVEIDPVAQTATTFGSLTGISKWKGGVLAPNGKIYGIPYSSATVLEIDPVAQTVTTFGSLTGSGKWAGGILTSNGKIYGIPYNSTTVVELATGLHDSPLWMLSAYVNKF